MYQYFVLGNQIRLAYRSVRYTGACHNQQIRFIHGTVGTGLSIIAHHTIVHRMVGGHYADPHHRGNNRNLMFFRKFPQFLPGAAQKHASAHTDNGSFRLFQFPDHFLNLHHMPLHRGLICAQIHFLRIFKPGNNRILNINGHINQYRPSPSCRSDVEGFFENTRNVVYIPDQVTVFYKRFRRTGYIRFLKHVGTDQFAAHLPCNTYKGNAVCKGGSNTG